MPRSSRAHAHASCRQTCVFVCMTISLKQTSDEILDGIPSGLVAGTDSCHVKLIETRSAPSHKPCQSCLCLGLLPARQQRDVNPSEQSKINSQRRSKETPQRPTGKLLLQTRRSTTCILQSLPRSSSKVLVRYFPLVSKRRRPLAAACKLPCDVIPPNEIRTSLASQDGPADTQSRPRCEDRQNLSNISMTFSNCS